MVSCLANLGLMLAFITCKLGLHLERVPLSSLLDKEYYVSVMTVAMTPYLDFMAFNILALITGTLGTLPLAAHAIGMTIYSSMTSFVMATQTILSNQISLFYSRGNLTQTCQIIFSALFLSVCFILTNVMVLFFLED